MVLVVEIKNIGLPYSECLVCSGTWPPKLAPMPHAPLDLSHSNYSVSSSRLLYFV